VAQKAEGGNEVEEEVEQRMVLQIIFTRQGSGFISAYGESDVRGLMPVEGVKRNGFKLSQCAFNASLQLAESRFVICKSRGFQSTHPRCRIFCIVASDADL